MKMSVHRWRIAFYRLLCGFIASAISMPVMADSASDFVSLGCSNSSCHGSPPGTGATKFTIATLNTDFPTNTDLATFIASNMPLGNPGACAGTCSQAMANYLRPPGPGSAPVANTSYTAPTVGVVPLQVSFFGTGSTDDQGIVSYRWDFDDGSSAISTALDGYIQRTYATVGTYTATLTVADAQGFTSTAPVKVYAVATHTPPLVNINKSSNLSGVAPLTTSLDASLSTCTGGCVGYIWEFDDNTSVSGITATHTYKDVGTHTVKLTVRDGGKYDGTTSGSDPATTTSINVTATVTASSRAPTANTNNSTNLAGAAPLTAKFDGNASNCDNNCSGYAWNFGDNQTGSGATINHTYSSPGTYTATLTVTDKNNGKTGGATAQIKVVPSESLASYVQACQTQLGFQNNPIPNLDCYDGDLFVKSDNETLNSINDRVGYKKITDQVDVAFACRWLFGDKGNRKVPVSIEMLVHNRLSGNTCYFSAKGPLSGNGGPRPDSHILSPNDVNAATFWEPPAVVDGSVRCINCHVSGPYIATPLIAPYLAKFGLLNNGHDTLSNVTQSDLSTPNKNVKYHAVSGTVNGAPGAFSLWDSQKQSYINPTYLGTSTTNPGCSLGCHSVGTLSPQREDIAQGAFGGAQTVLTSPLNQVIKINKAHSMPPYDDWSDYRWINLGIPDSGVESETFAAAIGTTTTSVPKLFGSDNPNCAQPNVPNVMEAHVVGSDNTFVVAQASRFAFLPDRLAAFNLKDGLTCLNSDQEPGQKCADYSIQYECTTITANTNSKTWVNWPAHAVSNDGDHEARNGANPCPSGSIATGIQAAVSLNGSTYSSIGPNDRLATFSQYGLTCNNQDQPDGQCSNYVVRYSSCDKPPATMTSRTLTNRNIAAGSKVLTTAANSLVKGQARNTGWNTQLWTVDPVPNTEYVRVRISINNVDWYLNVSSTADPAAVSIATFNAGWTSEMWLIEPINGSTDVRLKNLWTGKYLTMADPNSVDTSLKDYLPLYSQGRNTSWNTQRWLIQ